MCDQESAANSFKEKEKRKKKEKNKTNSTWWPLNAQNKPELMMKEHLKFFL